MDVYTANPAPSDKSHASTSAFDQRDSGAELTATNAVSGDTDSLDAPQPIALEVDLENQDQ
jgi:hypothetical protein